MENITLCEYNRIDINDQWVVKTIKVLDQQIYVVRHNNEYYHFQTVNDVLDFLQNMRSAVYKELLNHLTSGFC